MGGDDKTQETPEPWRGVMAEVAKMMKEALVEAERIAIDSGYDSISKDTIIKMGIAIFDATATAEGGRRMIEAQKQQSPITGGLVVQTRPDGRPVIKL